jgi:hypothetical protein
MIHEKSRSLVFQDVHHIPLFVRFQSRKFHNARFESKNSVISPHADISPARKLIASLPHNDGTSLCLKTWK